MTLDRRQILMALAALAAAPGAAASELVDPEGARRVGLAYLAAHPEVRDARSLSTDLPPAGWSAADLKRLRSRVAKDFRQGRVFVHRGWRISDTEGRLFALVALARA